MDSDKSMKQKLLASFSNGIDSPTPSLHKEIKAQNPGHVIVQVHNVEKLVDILQVESKIYSSTVSIPANYTKQKRLEQGEVKNTLRKISGIPLAMLYGLFFYLIMQYMILSQPCEYLTSNVTSHNNIQRNSCATKFGERHNSSHNITWHRNQTEFYPAEYRPGLTYISFAFSVTMAITSVVSRGTRCCMLLILPGLITRRSQTFLFTFVAGILAHGPIANLGNNFNELLENTVCLYERITKSVRKLLKVIRQRVQNLSRPDDIVVIRIEIMSNFTWKIFRDVMKAPRISEIKEQLSIIAKGMRVFGYYATIARKVLTIISIIMIVIDAMKYLRSYYSDNSFDNMYISKRVRHLWKQKEFEQLSPLRHWEINDGYKMSSSPKFTKRELIMSIRKALPTIIFSLFAVFVMLSDYLLAKLLQYIKDKENFTISFEGVEHKLMKKLKSFNISTDSCLSYPLYTSTYTYVFICFLLAIAAISCVLEVYMSRIRAAMCNVFYTERSQERADYLHYRINAGRVKRKLQLTLILRREIERRERLKEFSPWSDLKTFYCCARVNERYLCPGCKWKVPFCKTKDIFFTLGESTIEDKLCENCYLDF